MGESLDSIHEQLTSISQGLGRVEGTTEATAEDVKRINGQVGHVDLKLQQHIHDDSVMFGRVFARLSFLRGGIVVAGIVLGVVAGLFSGWLAK